MTLAQCTNNTQIPLSMAAWLAYDGYDYQPEENYISATSLLKSTRELVLGARIADKGPVPRDVSSLIPSRIGDALHGSVESTWIEHGHDMLRKLGYPEAVVARVVINPDPATVAPGQIPIYLERRAKREIDGYILGGKFDMVVEGIVEDIKTTQVYTFTSGKNFWKFRLQGSIYRWLNPEIVTADFMRINFIFHDWKAYEYGYRKDKGYPPSKVYGHKFKLMSIPETEAFIRRKLMDLQLYKDSPEKELPLCDDQELGRDASVFKYYKNPSKATKRSSGNFDTAAEANLKLIKDGSVGIIKEVKGKIKVCSWCSAFELCGQKDQLIQAGDLQL